MSVSHRVLRAVLALASLGLIALVYGAGGGVHLLAIALVLGTAYAVARPESKVVGLLIVGHAFHWTATAPAPEGARQWLGLLAGAWLALLIHVSASATATWPAVAPVPAGARRRWGLRTLAVAVATVPVWAVSAATRGQSLSGEVSMTYVAMAGLTLLGVAFFLVARRVPSVRR